MLKYYFVHKLGKAINMDANTKKTLISLGIALIPPVIAFLGVISNSPPTYQEIIVLVTAEVSDFLAWLNSMSVVQSLKKQLKKLGA
jgi:hypothetical protein